MRITKMILIFVIACLVSLPAIAQAQKGNKETELKTQEQPNTEILHFKDWVVRCENPEDTEDKSCFLFQRVALNSGQTVLSVTVAYPQTSEEAAAVFRLPLGIFLPAGAVIQVDKNEPIKLVVQRCDQKGCWAPLKLDTTTLTLLKKGHEAKVGFNNTGGKIIAVPLSLKGFTSGFKEITKKNRATR